MRAPPLLPHQQSPNVPTCMRESDKQSFLKKRTHFAPHSILEPHARKYCVYKVRAYGSVLRGSGVVAGASASFGERVAFFLACLVHFGLGGSGLRCGRFSTFGTRVLGAAFARFESTVKPLVGLGGSGIGCGCFSIFEHQKKSKERNEKRKEQKQLQ